MTIFVDHADRTDTSPPKTIAVGAGGLQDSRLVNPASPGSYINASGDPRLNSILAKTGSPLTTGIISQLNDQVDPKVQKYPYACRFLFNPTQIDVGYSVDEGTTPPDNLTPDQAKGFAVVPGTTAISFSLLFDRTYEVAYGPYKKGYKDLRNIGCYEDVWALESVVQARNNFSNAPVKAVGADGTVTTFTAAGPQASNMLMTTVAVIFGGGDGSSGGSAVPGLTYIGYINSMQVTYSHFSSRMIPMRCGVTISMQQMIGRTLADYRRNELVHVRPPKTTTSATTTSRR